MDGSVENSLGSLGFGGEVASISIQSNNLGERNRKMANLFLEQRISVLNRRLDITPGVVVNYFSAAGTKVYPGLDLGWQINPSLRGSLLQDCAPFHCSTLLLCLEYEFRLYSLYRGGHAPLSSILGVIL